METATPLSKTVRLSNEELGSFHKRVNEIVRRAEEGTIPYAEAMDGLQRIVERRQNPEIRYCPQAKPQKFEPLRRSEYRKSMGKLDYRLPESRRRLDWPERNPERIIAELWQAECIPEHSVNYGRTPVHAILGQDIVPAPHDIRIVNSTIQWLGTNIGMCFLRKFLGVSQIYIN